MNHHSLGLVNDQKIIVLVNNIYRDVLRDDIKHLRLGDDNADLFPAFEFIVFIWRTVIDLYRPVFDKLLYSISSQFVALFGDPFVKPFTFACLIGF